VSFELFPKNYTIMVGANDPWKWKHFSESFSCTKMTFKRTFSNSPSGAGRMAAGITVFIRPFFASTRKL